MENKLIDITEAAKYMSVKPTTFRKWVQRNQLPQELIVRIGNTIRIRSNVLNKIITGETNE